MNRIIKYNDEARGSIIKGVDTVANIVKTTLGPKGRNVLIRNNLDIPIITNDGVTIAKAIQLKDNAEDAGASLIISAANKTNQVAGDGTTTTTILAQAMIHLFNDIVLNSDDIKDYNVVQIQKDMIKASNEISDYLKEIAIPIKDTEGLKKVATISSGNEEIGTLIANAFENAGEYGSVIVENSKTGKDELTTIEGMKLSNGTVSHFLLNDHINLKSDVVDVSVLLFKDKIDSVSDLITVLDKCIPLGKKLLILCDDIELEPLQMVIMNKAQGRLSNINIVRLPGFAQLREDLLEDISIATGATILGRDLGTTLRDFQIEDLGELDQAIITLDDTILKFKNKTSTGIDLNQARCERVETLKTLLSNANESEQEQYNRRISNLLSGICTIQVGGNSEVEIKDKKLRIEDAINSVKAAKEEGIVPGGGYSFLSAFSHLMDIKTECTMGEHIVFEALKVITKQIAENAGYDGELVIKNCINEKLGFNAVSGNYENLIETGVINSVKVDRYSLINATSIASTVITMGGLIVDENEKDQNVLQLQTIPSMPSNNSNIALL